MMIRFHPDAHEGTMNIAVLIKHVVDSTEVRFDKNTGELRLRGLPEKISDYDKHAVEEAIRIKSKVGGKIFALSFGKKEAFKSLKEAIAMGADEGILIAHNKADQIYDPIFISRVLAKGIDHIGGCDLALCGLMTEDITNRIIGPTLASYLEYNHLTNVVNIDVKSEKSLFSVSEIDGMRVEIESEPPVVLSVSRKLNEPRLATKIQIMKVQMKKISTLSLNDLGLSEDIESEVGCEFESFTPITKTRKRIIFEEESVSAAKNLLAKLEEEGVL
jgi:electron transfer flavoprotein beta subunit